MGPTLLVALKTETVDMSRYVAGGNPAASVTEAGDPGIHARRAS